MKTHVPTNATETVVGYVRVCTQEQATERVSQNAQLYGLAAHCKMNRIRLIAANADQRVSDST